MATPGPESSPTLVTADNHSALVKIAVYFLTVTFILAVIFRFAIRLGIAKTVNVSDWVCFASMVSSP